MKVTITTALVAASAVRAQFQYLLPQARDDISPRDFGDGVCVVGMTCEECFGEGWITCDRIGCFNPGKFQQCCKDAVLCVAETDSCCEDHDGKGEIGTKAPVSNTLPPPSPSDPHVWYCTRGNTGEECCQGGGPDTHWCSGEFPRERCYNSTNQWCCTDGTVCEEEGCCQNLFSLDTTHPWSTASATPTPTPGSSPNNGNSVVSSTSGAAETSGTAETGAAADATPTEDATDAASLYTVKMELVGCCALVIAAGILM